MSNFNKNPKKKQTPLDKYRDKEGKERTESMNVIEQQGTKRSVNKVVNTTIRNDQGPKKTRWLPIVNDPNPIHDPISQNIEFPAPTELAHFNRSLLSPTSNFLGTPSPINPPSGLSPFNNDFDILPMEDFTHQDDFEDNASGEMEIAPRNNNNNNNNNNNLIQEVNNEALYNVENPIAETELPGWINLAASLLLYPVNTVLYRVLDRYHAAGDMAVAHEYARLTPIQQLSVATKTVPNIISTTLNQCIDISNMKHEFNGKFHLITKAPMSLFYNPRAESVATIGTDQWIFNTVTSFFKIGTLHNTSFGELSFTVNSFSHDMFTDAVHWIIPIAASIIESGGFAGYDLALIRHRFKKFTFFFQSSMGRLSVERGAVFQQINLGPYDIEDIAKERLHGEEGMSNFERFAEFADAVYQKWHAAMSRNFHNYTDDTDITDFKDTMESANRRIESVTIKFFPYSINENLAFPVTEPSQIQPKVLTINNQNLQVDPIALTGNAPHLILSRLYRHKPLPTDPSGKSAFNHIAHTSLLTGNNPAMAQADATGDEDVTSGKLHRYIANSIAKLTNHYKRPQEKNIIPSSILSSLPPRRAFNKDLTANQIENIIFAREEPLRNPLFFDEFGNPRNRPGHNVAYGDMQMSDDEELGGTIEIDHRVELPPWYDPSKPDYGESNAYNPEYGTDDQGAGCILDKRNQLEVGLSRSGAVWIPPNEIDFNCLLRCIKEFMKCNNMTDNAIYDLSFVEWREYFGIKHQDHIKIKDMQNIANSENFRFYIHNIVHTPYAGMSLALQQDPLQSKISHKIDHTSTISPQPGDADTVTINLLIHKEHCYLLKKPQAITNKQKCSRCCQWIIRQNFGNHIAKCTYCCNCKRAYNAKSDKEHICPKRLTPSEYKTQMIDRCKASICQDWTSMSVDKNKIKNSKLTKRSKIWFGDIETFSNADDQGFFEPYACGLISLQNREIGEVTIFYGENCMRDYLNFLTINVTSGNLVYFNGANFDNYHHIHQMLKHNHYINPSSIIKMGGKIISFEHSKDLRVFDLCLFIQSSLKNACYAWGVPVDESKKDFDHEKIKNFKDAETHKEEVTDYLRYDIKSLCALFDIFQRAMWECFSIDILSTVTPAMYALRAWSNTVPDELEHIYVPHTGKEEDDDRDAYYGGRVMCQRKTFDSEDWIKLNIPKIPTVNPRITYADINDFLVIGDVNSLYPAVQLTQLYAYGKWKYEELDFEGGPHVHYLQRINKVDGDEPLSSEWNWKIRCCFKVDIQCPKNIITSFLMERAPDGSILHNLNDKKEKWYWGSELDEAVRLGYKITRIHQIKEYEKCGPLFKKYIDKCWNERKKYESGTAKNLCFKFAMNGLTGKFGQKSHLTSTKIYNTSSTCQKNKEKKIQYDIENCVDFDLIFTNGSNNAIIMEVLNENISPSYPVYLSAQILAYARCHMSKLMRICGAYYEEENAIYYTDTDSLVIPSVCIPPLKAAGFIGKDIGQLKCDLNDSFYNQEFAKIIRGVWAATKGPYSLAYVLPESAKDKEGNRIGNMLWEKIKVKGIPHITKSVLYFDSIFKELDDKDDQLMDRVKRWLEQPMTYQLPTAIIGQKFYLFKSEIDNTTFYAHNVCHDMIRKMMLKEGSIYAYYGGMKKEFIRPDGQPLMIRPTAVKRTLCKTDWWAKGKRIYNPYKTNYCDLSYPVGYEF